MHPKPQQGGKNDIFLLQAWWISQSSTQSSLFPRLSNQHAYQTVSTTKFNTKYVILFVHFRPSKKLLIYWNIVVCTYYWLGIMIIFCKFPLSIIIIILWVLNEIKCIPNSISNANYILIISSFSQLIFWHKSFERISNATFVLSWLM